MLILYIVYCLLTRAVASVCLKEAEQHQFTARGPERENRSVEGVGCVAVSGPLLPRKGGV